jgi:hypothetical protein
MIMIIMALLSGILGCSQNCSDHPQDNNIAASQETIAWIIGEEGDAQA